MKYKYKYKGNDTNNNNTNSIGLNSALYNILANLYTKCIVDEKKKKKERK